VVIQSKGRLLKLNDVVYFLRKCERHDLDYLDNN